MKYRKVFKLSLVLVTIFTLSLFTLFGHESSAATSKAKVTQHYYSGKKFLKYPQVSSINKSAKKRINDTFKKHMKKSYQNYLNVKKDEKETRKNYPKVDPFYYKTSYKVKYSTKQTLSIIIYDDIYLGGAHGNSEVTTYNFKISTGKQVKIKDLLNTKSKYLKVQKYAYNYFHKTVPYNMYVKKLKDVKLNQFYYTKNGIYLIYQQYEIAPYAAGHPIYKIPSSVYKK